MPEESPTQFVRRLMPLCATLGVRVQGYRPEQVELALDWAPGLCTSGGVLHGGVIMALADSAAGMCAFLNLPPAAAGTATIEGKTNFLAAIRSGTATAAARPLHVGGRTIVVETDVRAGDGRLVARTCRPRQSSAGPGPAATAHRPPAPAETMAPGANHACGGQEGPLMTGTTAWPQAGTLADAAQRYVTEVASQHYPDHTHSYA